VPAIKVTALSAVAHVLLLPVVKGMGNCR
jgi:hypothetical protein